MHKHITSFNSIIINNKDNNTKRRRKIKTQQFQNEKEAPILLVDSSYVCFYKIYALQIWYGLANPEQYSLIKEDDDYNWTDNKDFMMKFENTYINPFVKLMKIYNVPMSNLIFAIDCPRNQIWRMQHFTNYKANRDSSKHRKANVKELFKFTYSKIIPELEENHGIKTIRSDNAEADDVIAVIKNEIRRIQPNRKIIIVTGDHDFFQLSDSNTHIVNLKNKNLLEKSCGDPKKDLLKKIIQGDSSDNINSVFDKCGVKTTQKFIDNMELFYEKIEKDPKAKKKFEYNKLLIDFDHIPENIKQSIIDSAYELKIIPREHEICNKNFKQLDISKFLNGIN